MTTINDIFEYTESFAPISLCEDWDNCGLLVGDKSSAVTKVMVSLDITNDVVKEAKELGCQLIISHHPVIFEPIKSISPDSVVYKLIKNDISALCLHTNLDLSADGGVNICLANALKLDDACMIENEFLCIGKLNKSLAPKDFAEYVKTKLNCTSVRYTNGKSITTVAVSSGAGGDSIELHKKYGFDALVTGEIKHHQLLYAVSHGICVVEAGHFCTEDVVISPLVKRLSQQFCEVEFFKSSALKDPVSSV